MNYDIKRDKEIKQMHQNKMKRWDETAFNILIGQAINLWAESSDPLRGDIRSIDDWVTIILSARASPKIRQIYEDYLNREAIELEKAEQALLDAEIDAGGLSTEEENDLEKLEQAELDARADLGGLSTKEEKND